MRNAMIANNNENIIIALWAAPRTLSTPVERVFIEKKDSEVFHEPFFNAYYYSKDRVSQRVVPQETAEEKKNQDYHFITGQLLSPCKKKIRFFKDMAFYSYDYLKKNFPEFYHKIIHTFIIRDTHEALISHYKVSPDFNAYPEEAGFEKLYKLFEYITVELKQKAIVIDADELAGHPKEVIKKYCEEIGIPYDESALSWEAGKKIKAWEDWEDWHVDTLNSSGIYPIEKEKISTTIPRWLISLIKDSQPYYEAMLQHSLLRKNDAL